MSKKESDDADLERDRVAATHEVGDDVAIVRDETGEGRRSP